MLKSRRGTLREKYGKSQEPCALKIALGAFLEKFLHLVYYVFVNILVVSVH
jgi:hypothetical protein